MKCTTNLFLFIVLCIYLSGCSNLQTSVAQTKEPVITGQSTPQKSPLMEQDNDILSNDYKIAEKALDKAVLEKDKNTIRIGLKSEFLDIRKKVVEIIAEFNDEAFIPNLIIALQENQGLIGGGTETQIFQNDLNKAIISALEHLTKLKFEISEPLSSEDIQKVLKESQAWWKIHQSRDR